ncbi:MAG: hypothetical protein F4056_02720 [Chloroflexi bacterium]|nr:hypothetical protein [Chloroflexota bacterium]
MKVEYVVVYERGEENYCGYVPDLPGCTSAGDDLEDMRRMMREAIALYVDTMRGSGSTVPSATSTVAEAMVEHARILSEPLGKEVEALMAEQGMDMPTPAIETIFSVIEVDVDEELDGLEIIEAPRVVEGPVERITSG